MKDLSSLAPDFGVVLTAGESQAAGNTVSTLAKEVSMCAPGSDPVDPMPQIGAKEDSPAITASGTITHDSVLTQGNDSLPSGNTWKKAGD
jgi:hypothetical protein